MRGGVAMARKRSVSFLRRLTYLQAIAWLAGNAGIDRADTEDEIAGMVIVHFAGEVYARFPSEVAKRIVSYRKRAGGSL